MMIIRQPVSQFAKMKKARTFVSLEELEGIYK